MDVLGVMSSATIVSFVFPDSLLFQMITLHFQANRDGEPLYLCRHYSIPLLLRRVSSFFSLFYSVTLLHPSYCITSGFRRDSNGWPHLNNVALTNEISIMQMVHSRFAFLKLSCYSTHIQEEHSMTNSTYFVTPLKITGFEQ